MDEKPRRPKINEPNRPDRKDLPEDAYEKAAKAAIEALHYNEDTGRNYYRELRERREHERQGSTAEKTPQDTIDNTQQPTPETASNDRADETAETPDLPTFDDNLNFAPDVFEPEPAAHVDPYDDPYAGQFDDYLIDDDVTYDNFDPDVFEDDDSWDPEPVEDTDRDLWGPDATDNPDTRQNRDELAGRAAALGAGALHEPSIHRVPADESPEDDSDFDDDFGFRDTPHAVRDYALGVPDAVAYDTDGQPLDADDVTAEEIFSDAEDYDFSDFEDYDEDAVVTTRRRQYLPYLIGAAVLMLLITLVIVLYIRNKRNSTVYLKKADHTTQEIVIPLDYEEPTEPEFAADANQNSEDIIIIEGEDDTDAEPTNPNVQVIEIENEPSDEEDDEDTADEEEAPDEKEEDEDVYVTDDDPAATTPSEDDKDESETSGNTQGEMTVDQTGETPAPPSISKTPLPNKDTPAKGATDRQSGVLGSIYMTPDALDSGTMRMIDVLDPDSRTYRSPDGKRTLVGSPQFGFYLHEEGSSQIIELPYSINQIVGNRIQNGGFDFIAGGFLHHYDFSTKAEKTVLEEPVLQAVVSPSGNERIVQKATGEVVLMRGQSEEYLTEGANLQLVYVSDGATFGLWQDMENYYLYEASGSLVEIHPVPLGPTRQLKIFPAHDGSALAFFSPGRTEFCRFHSKDKVEFLDLGVGLPEDAAVLDASAADAAPYSTALLWLHGGDAAAYQGPMSSAAIDTLTTGSGALYLIGALDANGYDFLTISDAATKVQMGGQVTYFMNADGSLNYIDWREELMSYQLAPQVEDFRASADASTVLYKLNGQLYSYNAAAQDTLLYENVKRFEVSADGNNIVILNQDGKLLHWRKGQQELSVIDEGVDEDAFLFNLNFDQSRLASYLTGDSFVYPEAGETYQYKY